MKYIFETENKNYEDFSSGRVLYNQKGATSFPVRLASEIFQRCKKHLEKKGVRSPFTIYDPCCGGGYLLTTLGFLHGNDLYKIIASDIDKNILNLAERNLSLLTVSGINNRIQQIQEYIRQYDKDSHKQALQSAYRLKSLIETRKITIGMKLFQADALNIQSTVINDIFKADLIITDIPYGSIVKWSEDSADNIEKFLDSMVAVIKPSSILAIIADKKQVIRHQQYNRVEYFKLGKRQITILEENCL